MSKSISKSYADVNEFGFRVAVLLGVNGNIVLAPIAIEMVPYTFALAAGYALKKGIQYLAAKLITKNQVLAQYANFHEIDPRIIEGESHRLPRLDEDLKLPTKTKLEVIEAKIKELTENPEYSIDKHLLTYGIEALRLGGQLSVVYTTDFMVWNRVYEDRKDVVQRLLTDLKSGRFSPNDLQVVHSLLQIFNEALESTNKIKRIGQSILDLTKKNKLALESLNPDNYEASVQADIKSQIEILQVQQNVQENSIMTFSAVNESFGQTMRVLQTLSLGIQEQMNGNISTSIEPSLIDELKQNLNKVEQHFTKLNQQ